MNDLRQNIIDELHSPVRRNFPRRNTVIKGMGDLYQADIVEMIPYSKLNKGFKYILTVIDCFTKIAHCVPLKDKTGRSVTSAMEKLLKDNRMKHLQTDAGKEYYNKSFSGLMKKYEVNHYSTNSEIKAAVIERFNRTIKNMMYKTFSQRGTHVWYDILQSIVHRYNSKKHRTIGMAPIDVSNANASIVMERIKKNTRPGVDKRSPKLFKIGDKVRISKHKKVFTKGYLPNWSNEVFTVHRIQPTTPVTYILKDHVGEILHGCFYGHELLLTTSGDVYLVEKILRKKGDMILVRWLGFDKRDDSWIHKSDLI